MNIYKAMVNGELRYVKASNEEKAKVKLYHIYKKKYGKVWITDIKFVKAVKPKPAIKEEQIKLKFKKREN